MSIINKANNKPTFISMDLGTSNTLVYVSGQGVVYNEPSIIAYKIKENKIIAIGAEAYKMIGKGNKSIRIVKPMVDGVITDIRATESQLKYIFKKLRLEKSLKHSIVLLACPSVITELEKTALKKIATNLGADRVFVEEEVKMAALGGGVNIYAPTGNLIVDMGGGTTDIAVMASGDIVLSKSIKVAGNYLNDECQKFIRSQYGLEIGTKSAESIKITIGSLSKFSDERKMKVYGRDVVSGLPREIEITPEEIRDLLKVPVSRIIDLTVQVLEDTPPELAGDIYRNGITLCGGGALIKGMDKYFADTLQLPTRIGEQPLLAVINGTKKFENEIFEILKAERTHQDALENL
ncbi:rod shape-determining protein MreB [Spiroplasma sp. TIUS-1]|uniref:rod shape-determining protein n=1 Tax=Spiroplasma sp. TIUS-1 TaxID=216963 RepID=UPI0013996B4F|nr:rod shape-determining protein [Spiroplasma sp. TIUS-1]QHX36245.1 rod shape-determining protein MreB [Spiroplasma sp. TIUS-1]